ncbi:uncharacterized protein CIMG_08756 [Coccidioides immitis RS]|uniref:Uncharacterized protein n=1 Tax=Coccidioides immitis (strain RS) TaxID=246410 RepID=J3K649_COCIM|nr:uncharacterized protein CIMG_08756 [Coccidioides immitis RS]EAS30010.3 hypothetical protein CIMG_08756 [Coccidioides immitis RS]
MHVFDFLGVCSPFSYDRSETHFQTSSALFDSELLEAGLIGNIEHQPHPALHPAAGGYSSQIPVAGATYNELVFMQPSRLFFTLRDIVRIKSLDGVRHDSCGTHRMLVTAETPSGLKAGECEPETFIQANNAQDVYEEKWGVWGSDSWRKDMGLPPTWVGVVAKYLKKHLKAVFRYVTLMGIPSENSDRAVVHRQWIGHA